MGSRYNTADKSGGGSTAEDFDPQINQREKHRYLNRTNECTEAEPLASRKRTFFFLQYDTRGEYIAIIALLQETSIHTFTLHHQQKEMRRKLKKEHNTMREKNELQGGGRARNEAFRSERKQPPQYPSPSVLNSHAWTFARKMYRQLKHGPGIRLLFFVRLEGQTQGACGG